MMAPRPMENRASEFRDIARFVGAGILNTSFGYAVYLAGLAAGLPPVAALAAATLVGAIFNFFSTGWLVFGSAAIGKLPAFAVAYLVTYLFNAAILQLLTSAHVSAWLAQIIALPPVAAASYGLLRLWVFRSER